MESNKPKGLSIVIPTGLNQLYTHDKKIFFNTSDIFVFIMNEINKKYAIGNITGKDYEELMIISQDLNNKAYEDKIKEKYNIDFKECLQSLKDVLFKEFYFVEKHLLESIIKEGHRIILLHDDPFSLFIEYNILLINSDINLYEFELKNDTFFQQLKNKEPSYVVFDYRVDRLYQFHQLGCWTIYLTHFLFTSLYIDGEQNPFFRLNNENMKLIGKEGKFFAFSTHIFYQLKHYFYLIIQVNNENTSGSENYSTILNKKIEEINPIRVILYYKIFFKKGELRKADYYISNDKVLFISHIGGNINVGIDEVDIGLEMNGKFDAILMKFSEIQEVNNYSKFIEKVDLYISQNPQILLLNSSKHFTTFMKRDSMIQFLRNFCDTEQTHLTGEKFNTKLIIPKSISVPLLEVYEYEQFIKFINENNLQLPIIIKYTGPRADFNHLLINIITDEGIRNYVQFMKQYSKDYEDKISTVMQTYVNHGGYVLKLYRVNRKSIVFTRPSLPDANEELTKKCEEYKNGFYKVSTNELLSNEYLKFWEKLSKNESIKNSINLEYLNLISAQFENFCEMTLFGLDFLYDISHNEYSLVDCNVFPGYKEMVNGFNSVIIEHILNYYSEFKQRGKIFSN